MQAWFRTDADCLDYLAWLRWPNGFVCPSCAHVGGWQLGDGRFECSGCHTRTSTTAGTIFDRTRTPLTVWFNACWLFASGKDGISALSLKRTLEIGSVQTAWMILHRLRSVLVRPGRERLTGTVEVDETFIGGEEPGLRGGRARGKKVLTGIAVEIRPRPKGIGRCRMAPLADASAASLRSFLTDHVEPGTTVITDGWSGYKGIDKLGYIHQPRSQRAARARGEDPGELLPVVHRVASLVKRWLLGTHQGAVNAAHLPSYLDEFVFRFNRRHSRSRGMVFYRVLELAVEHGPVRYHDVIASSRPRDEPPDPPLSRGHPPSLDRAPANRPWRTRAEYSG
jgi:transposase-like protein